MKNILRLKLVIIMLIVLLICFFAIIKCEISNKSDKVFEIPSYPANASTTTIVSGSATTTTILSTQTVNIGSLVTGNIIVNEVNYDDASSDLYDEYVELYNATTYCVNLSGGKIWYASSASPPSKSVSLTGCIKPKSYYTILKSASGLIGSNNADLVTWGLGSGTGDFISNNSGSIVLTRDSTSPTNTSDPDILDRVQWKSTGDVNPCQWCENAIITGTNGKSITRDANHTDTNNNSADFSIGGPNGTPTKGGCTNCN